MCVCVNRRHVRVALARVIAGKQREKGGGLIIRKIQKIIRAPRQQNDATFQENLNGSLLLTATPERKRERFTPNEFVNTNANHPCQPTCNGAILTHHKRPRPPRKNARSPLLPQTVVLVCVNIFLEICFKNSTSAKHRIQKRADRANDRAVETVGNITEKSYRIIVSRGYM